MDKQELMARMRARKLEAGLGKRIGRGSGRKMGLLDDEDLNIGNALEVAPFGPTDGSATIREQTNPPRLLNLDGLSQRGQTITVGLAARTFLRASNISQSNPVLTTGIIEVGNGGVFTKVEVDIPIGRITAIGGVLLEPEDGFTLVTVPAGTLRVYARNDAHLIVPDNNGLVGNAAVNNLEAPNSAGNTDSSFVTAFATYFTVRAAVNAPTRTYYIGKSGAGFSGAITYTDDPARSYLIPPLAKRFRIYRYAPGPVMPSLTGTVYDADGEGIYTFSTAVDVIDPFKDLPGHAHRVGIAMVLPVGGNAMITWEIGA